MYYMKICGADEVIDGNEDFQKTRQQAKQLAEDENEEVIILKVCELQKPKQGRRVEYDVYYHELGVPVYCCGEGLRCVHTSIWKQNCLGVKYEGDSDWVTQPHITPPPHNQYAATCRYADDRKLDVRPARIEKIAFWEE